MKPKYVALLLCLAAIPVAALRCKYDVVITSSTDVGWLGQQDYTKVNDGFLRNFWKGLVLRQETND